MSHLEYAICANRWNLVLLRLLFTLTVFAFTFSQTATAQPADANFADHGRGLAPVSREVFELTPQTPVYRGLIEERIDLSNDMPPVHEKGQGQQGSCVAWAIGYAARGYYSRSVEKRDIFNASSIPSPAYIYNSLTTDFTCKSGINMRDALNLLVARGAPSLKAFPYSANYCGRPANIINDWSPNFGCSGYYGVDYRRLDQVKSALGENNPVIVGMRLFEPEGHDRPGPFDRLQANEIYRVAPENSPPLMLEDNHHSFHAMVVVGYDDRIRAFKLMNSWGRTWANGGFGWVDYETFRSNVDEAYVMKVNASAPVCQLSAVDLAPSAQGANSVLVMNAQNADSAFVDHGVGVMSINERKPILVAETATYTATVKGRGGQSTCSTTIAVKSPTPISERPSISSFTASPRSIDRGQSAKLSWNSRGAKSFFINNGIGELVGNFVYVSPQNTTTYELTARGEGANVSAKLEIEVSPPPEARPTCSLFIEPAKITSGSRAKLSFISSNSTVGNINQGIGSVSPSGSTSVSPHESTIYEGIFTGSAGEARCSVKLLVEQPKTRLPVISSFAPIKGTIAPGETTVLSWTVTDAKTFEIDEGVGLVQGCTKEVAPTEPKRYILTAKNEFGSTSASTSVIVSNLPSLLSTLRCSNVTLFDRGDKFVAAGFVAGQDDLNQIRETAQSVLVDVEVRPFPQCEALKTLSEAVERSPMDQLKVRIRRKTDVPLKAGENLIFEIVTPSYESYVHVAYIQADGSVVNLLQSGPGLLNTRPPRSKIILGERYGTGSFHVKEPFGREMLIALSGKRPVFPEQLPDQQTEREFLSALRLALISKPYPSAPDPDVVAGYDFIVTEER